MQVSLSYTVAPEGEGQLQTTPCPGTTEAKGSRRDSHSAQPTVSTWPWAGQAHSCRYACSACCQAVLTRVVCASNKVI